jgi:hypothetical protein
MPRTKLWLVSHVAMATTARPMVEANNTRQPSCSRIGIRILTILCHAQRVCFYEGLGASRLGTQRVSVSRGARALSNVRDEAVEERGVSSVSHSSWRVCTCVWSCRWRCGKSGEAKYVMLGLRGRLGGVNARQSYPGTATSQMQRTSFGETGRGDVFCFVRRGHVNEDDRREKRGRAGGLWGWRSTEGRATSSAAVSVGPLQWKPARNTRARTRERLGSGRDWVLRCG